MTSVFSWKNCYPLPCFVLYSKAKLACYSRYLLTSYFCISIPYDENNIFFWCCFQKVLQVFIEPFNISFFRISGWSIDLFYHDGEWFALETSQDQSVTFEIVPKYCISDCFVSISLGKEAQCKHLTDQALLGHKEIFILHVDSIYGLNHRALP